MSDTTRVPFCVRGVLYTTKGDEGDFKWMIKQPQYDNTLFIYMENFLDSVRQDSEAGGGTACLRPHSLYHQPDRSYKLCAAGVPTGWSHETHGFPIMDAQVKLAIDLAFERILILLYSKMRYVTEVIYSADSNAPEMIGTGIFKKTIGFDVVQYISRCLNRLPSQAAPLRMLEIVRLQELTLLRTALLAHNKCVLQAEKRKRKADRMQALSASAVGSAISPGRAVQIPRLHF